MAPRLANRSEKRKNATEREKARMVAISRDIDHIQSLVCPEMNQPTKSKVLRVAVDRLTYLENLFMKLQQMEENGPVGNESLRNQSVGNHSLENQSLGNHAFGNQSLGDQPAHSQPLQIQGHQRATQRMQNSSIGPNSPDSFNSSEYYSPVDYSNQSYPDESLNSQNSNLSSCQSSNDQIQIPSYQPFQSYEQADQQICWEPNQAAGGEQYEPTTSFSDFLQLENQEDTLQSQADTFFQQFENEIQNCL